LFDIRTKHSTTKEFNHQVHHSTKVTSGSWLINYDSSIMTHQEVKIKILTHRKSKFHLACHNVSSFSQVAPDEYFSTMTTHQNLRQVSGINPLIKMSTYRLASGDSEIAWVGWLIQPNTYSFHVRHAGTYRTKEPEEEHISISTSDTKSW